MDNNSLIITTYDGKQIIVDKALAPQIADMASLIEIKDKYGNVSYINKSSVANITPIYSQIPANVLDEITTYSTSQEPTDQVKRQEIIDARVKRYINTKEWR